MRLEELHEAGHSLANLLRLRTHPLAVKLYRNTEEFPARLHRPKDFGARWAICQGMTMARKIGWTVGVTREESTCPSCNIFFGWAELKDEADFVNAWLEMGVGGNSDAVKRNIEEHWWLNKGEYAGIVFSPLEWTAIVPDVLLIYCDPTQAMLLVGACTFKKGGSVKTSLHSACGCVGSIIQPLLTGEPKVTLPCAGGKGLDMTQDNELVFSFPLAILEEVVSGLQGQAKKGYLRMPVVPYVMFETKLVPPYAELDKKLQPI